MKKLSYFFLAAAGLTMASCSQDDLSGGVSKEESNYAVQVSIPKTMVTRAFEEFGEGYEALKLQVAVYDDGDLVQEFTDEFGPESLTTTVYFNLARGKSYQIAFFAQSETSIDEGVYTFTPSTAVLSVDYTKMSSEGNLADAYDCFLGVLETKEITAGGLTTSIELTRPVAQVNWGTNDLFTTEESTDDSGNTTTTQNPTVIADAKAYGVNGKYIMTNLTVNNPYNTLNVLNNTMTQAGQAVTINSMAAPYTFTFPLDEETSGQDPEDYIYVAMSYLLAPVENSTVYDLNLDVNNQGEPTSGDTAGGTVNTNVGVSAVPVQANYQTNIYGNLLSENVDVTVTKNPEWTTPSYDLPLGNMIAPGLYKDGNTYTIMSPAGLEYYAQNIGVAANLNNGLSGITVLLGADLDMTGITHTPIYNCSATFDGQKHTISNLSVTQSNGDSAGLFASTIGTVKNLTITDATIVGNYKAGVLGGDAIASNIQNVTILNSTVTSTPWKKNGAWDDGNNVGGLVGYLSAETTGNVENCTVSGCTIIGMRKVGGIVGYANGNCTITGCEISNTSVIADLVTNYYGDTTPTSENVVGAIASNGTGVGTTYNTGNTIGENVTTSIVATGSNGEVQLNSGTMADFTYFADVISKNPNNFSKKTIQFAKDAVYDFTGYTLDPIGYWNPEGAITVDGNNCTLKNITLAPGIAWNDNYAASIFSRVTGSFQNFNIDGMTGENIQARFAGFIGNLYGSMTNVHATNVNITSSEGRVGALVGIHNSGNMTNCSVSNSSITADWSSGGIIGGINETDNRTFTDLKAENVTINVSSTFGGTYSQMYGGLIGLLDISGATFSGCTMTGCTVNGTENSQVAFNYSYDPYTWNNVEYDTTGIQTWPKD